LYAWQFIFWQFIFLPTKKSIRKSIVCLAVYFRGHKELGDLAAALGRAGSAASSLRSSSAPPALPSAGVHSELAGEIGFSYRMSISQPAEILTI
jgi:hypothetical protein